MNLNISGKNTLDLKYKKQITIAIPKNQSANSSKSQRVVTSKLKFCEKTKIV